MAEACCAGPESSGTVATNQHEGENLRLNGHVACLPRRAKVWIGPGCVVAAALLDRVDTSRPTPAFRAALDR